MSSLSIQKLQMLKDKKMVRINYKIIKFSLIFLMVNAFFLTNTSAKITTTDRCETALQLMGVDASGTDRGWASLCAGVIKNDGIFQYGNWYGPGYWGGERNLHKAGLKAPVDSLDEIAMHHDYGYVIAEKYGKIYGKKYEYKLKAMADKIAVRDSMRLPKDPRKWKKVPADIEKASRYRDRMTTAFIMESDLYKNLGDATKVGDAVTSPFITWFDKIDYEQIPDLKKFKMEVSSHIRGWEKDVAKKKQEEKKEKEKKTREEAVKRAKEIREKVKEQLEEKKKQAKEIREKVKEQLEKKRKLMEAEAKKEKAKKAKEARERLKKKIAQSKKEQIQAPKSYENMTPKERRDALKQNDDKAWEALQKELSSELEEEGENGEKSQPKSDKEVEVLPVKIVTTASYDGDYSAGEFRNIVTTTVTLSFWNVGSKVTGYGGVTMKSRSVSSLNGSNVESNCKGTFSGGPNGVIRLYGSCAGATLKVNAGRSVSGGGMNFSISNPSAFEYWNK